MSRNLKIVMLLGVMMVFSSVLAQKVNPAQIDSVVTQQMERYKAPGLGFALILDGKVVYSKGYGMRNLSSKAPVTPDTVFAIASISKSFTSLALMQQVAAGKVGLDKAVVGYLPKLKFSDTQKGQQLTVRHVLANASGLSRYDNWIFDPSIDSRQKVLDTVAKIPFAAQPGSAFEYNNQNYLIAGAVLEQATGQSWEQYVQQNIFRPLGMSRAQFSYTAAAKAGNVATPYGFTAKGIAPIANYDQIGSDTFFKTIGPAGGILASLNDMSKYTLFQLNSRTTQLPKPLFDEMHKQQVTVGHAYDPILNSFLDDVRGYGLGWYKGEYRGMRGFGHGGNIQGFTSMVFVLPQQRLGMVLLTNLNGANDFLDTTRLMLLEQLFDLQPRTDFSRSPIVAQTEALIKGQGFKPDPTVLQKLAGNYALVNGGSMELIFENNTLLMSQFGARFPLTPLSNELYLAELQGLSLFIEAKLDPSGMVWLRQDGHLAGAKVFSSTAKP